MLGSWTQIRHESCFADRRCGTGICLHSTLSHAQDFSGRVESFPTSLGDTTEWLRPGVVDDVITNCSKAQMLSKEYWPWFPVLLRGDFVFHEIHPLSNPLMQKDDARRSHLRTRAYVYTLQKLDMTSCRCRHLRRGPKHNCLSAYTNLSDELGQAFVPRAAPSNPRSCCSQHSDAHTTTLINNRNLFRKPAQHRST